MTPNKHEWGDLRHIDAGADFRAAGARKVFPCPITSQRRFEFGRIPAAQLAYMLDGIDWRSPRHTFRPERAG